MLILGLTQEENERRILLYDQGLSDCEIGRVLGRNSSTIWVWRKRSKLPAKREHHGRRPLPNEEESRRLQAHEKGLSDSELARELNVTIFGVRSWRRSRNLAGHPKYDYKHLFLSLEEERQRYIIYNANPLLGDYRMAKMLGITQASFRGWRVTRGLPAHCRQKVKQNMKELDVEAFLSIDSPWHKRHLL